MLAKTRKQKLQLKLKSLEDNNLLDNHQLILILINKWLNIITKKQINLNNLTIEVYRHIIRSYKENHLNKEFIQEIK